MPWFKWIVLGLAVLEAGWLTFDGSRALLTGDYVTPRSGPHAGELGGWSKLVSSIGVDPRSTLMKIIHVGLGSGWLIVAGCFALRQPWADTGMLVCAVLGLWYLPVGTVLSIIQIALLLLLRVNSS